MDSLSFLIGYKKGAAGGGPALETETRTVAADFSGGDMTVAPSEEGKVMTEVVVTKPATLTPENIAEGVDIAGIIGTLAASGGGGAANIKYKKGVVTRQTNGVGIITHNLGVIPDLIMVWAVNFGTWNTDKGGLMFVYGITDAFAELIGETSTNRQNYVLYNKNNGTLVGFGDSNPIEASGDLSTVVHDATTTTALVDSTTSSYGGLNTGVINYAFFAIGGLTPSGGA